jgi:hypothetical protein
MAVTRDPLLDRTALLSWSSPPIGQINNLCAVSCGNELAFVPGNDLAADVESIRPVICLLDFVSHGVV